MIVDLICFGFGLLMAHLKMTSRGIRICDGHFLRVIDYQESYFLFKSGLACVIWVFIFGC